MRAGDFERPGSVSELSGVLERAGRSGARVRVAGSGHSFTSLVLTDGTLVSLERMDRVLDVDHGSGLVRVEAGITIPHLNLALDAHGLALENLGDIDKQSIAGATATGTHGTGVSLRNLSGPIQAVELMRADGTMVKVDAQSDPDAWCAARVSLGALGVVTALTIQAVPASGCAESMVRLRSSRRSTRSPSTRAARPLRDVLVPVLRHGAAAVQRSHRRATDAAFGDAPLRRGGPAGQSWTRGVLTHRQALPSHDTSTQPDGDAGGRFERSCRRLARDLRLAPPGAFHRDGVRDPQAIRGAGDQGGSHVIQGRRLSVSFPIEVRFVAGDDALLSPAHGRDTCYIAVHVFEGMDYETYFRAVEEIMTSSWPSPLGQAPLPDRRDLASALSGVGSFQAVRAAWIPGGFSNAELERVLGPRAGTEPRPLAAGWASPIFARRRRP